MKEIKKKAVASMLLGTMCLYSMPVLANTKEETVYTKLDNNSKVYSSIVSTKLSNDNKSELLEDITDLLNIKNTNGDEEFTRDGDKIIWKSKGKNIQYQGETNKETPVTCKIKYELNGEEVTAEKIVGKSGKVKIIIEYTNNEKHTVTINGQNSTMYTPFVVVTGTIIDKKNNENIQITNGKLIDNGTKTVAIGIAMPGLQESLNLSKEKAEIPNSVIIEMDAKEFEMNNIMSYITAKVLGENDLNMLEDLDKIYSQANELKEASNMLVDGSRNLRDGAYQLNSGIHQLSKELNSKISLYENERSKYSTKDDIKAQIVKILNQELKTMMPELEKQAEQEARKVVHENIEDLQASTISTTKQLTSEAINVKLQQLENGEPVVPENVEKALEKDIQIIINNMLDTEEIQTLETAIKTIVLNDIQNILNSKMSEIKTTTNNVKTQAELDPMKLLTTQEQAEVEKMAQAMVLGIIENYYKNEIISGQITEEQAKQIAYNDALSNVKKLISSTVVGTISSVENEIDKKVSEAMTEISTSLSSNKELNTAIIQYANKIACKIKASMSEAELNALKKSIGQNLLKNIKETLANDIEINEYAQKELSGTIDAVADKTATTLAEQYTETLATEVATNLVKAQLSGENIDKILEMELSKYETTISTVDSGIAELKKALSQLTNGSTALSNGTNTLSEGMKKFDNEAISKIYNLVYGDVKDIEERVKVLKELAEQYKTFTKINDKDNGEVSFITIIDSLKKDDDEKAVSSNNKTNETVADEKITNNSSKVTTSGE